VTLKPKHPYARKIETDLRQLKQELAFQIELIEEKRLARIQSLKEDEASYLPLIEELRRQVLSSRNTQYEFERLREEETNVKNVLHDLRKAEESLNATTADDALFHIIEEGVGSPVPIRPDRSKIVLTGLLLGLSVGLGLVYLLGRLDDRFESPDEIQAALEEPILAQLPNIDRRRLKIDRLLLTSLAEHHLYRESLRGLRSALFPGTEARSRKLLLLTSAAPGEGKTTVSVNLASTLALAGHRVCWWMQTFVAVTRIVFFSHQRTPGLSEVLSGKMTWQSVRHVTDIGQLHLIHSGELPRNPGELLLQPTLQAFWMRCVHNTTPF
jgi:tyrosine-protein kinase Etk/Wzc